MCTACPSQPIENAFEITGLVLKSPFSAAAERRINSCGTILPAPIFWWPTSLLPMTPLGRPTLVPLVSIIVVGWF